MWVGSKRQTTSLEFTEVASAANSSSKMGNEAVRFRRSRDREQTEST